MYTNPCAEGPEAVFQQFGRLIRQDDLKLVVLYLYKNATSESSRRSSKCGINHFHRFALQYLGTKIQPTTTKSVSLKGLLLSFFAASLFVNPKNLQYATIRNYVGHIRAKWSQAGSPLLPYDHEILARVLKGISTLRPTKPDTRTAFLLPHIKIPPNFSTPLTSDQLIFKAAVIFGFLGMFRYGTFDKLSVNSLILVCASGIELSVKEGTWDELGGLMNEFTVTGFYFRFASKFHPRARAYFCRLDDLPMPWSALCPVSALIALAKNNMLSKRKIFARSVITTRKLGAYMRSLSNSNTNYTPHSLRIGGHTFYSIQNMHEDFVQFLGRRAIARASQLYYRANAADNVSRLRLFFEGISRIPILQSGLYGAP